MFAFLAAFGPQFFYDLVQFQFSTSLTLIRTAK